MPTSPRVDTCPPGAYPADMEATADQSWIHALQRLRTVHGLGPTQIGREIQCSPKSVRRWTKAASGIDGGSYPLAPWRDRLVRLAGKQDRAAEKTKAITEAKAAAEATERQADLAAL